MANNLPSDGTEVTAMTYESLSDDLLPKSVQGKLSTRTTPLRAAKGLGPQCWVDGILVDPETIQPIDEVDEDEDED